MDMSGIPRGFDMQGMRRELDALRREVERQTSARTYVSVGNIVEGGTIDTAVGDKLTETVKDKIVIDSDNLGDAALDDRVITGSVFRTAAEGPRTEMNQYGVETTGLAVQNQASGPVRYTPKAVMGNRHTADSWGENDRWPGVWFETPREDGSVPNPRWPAGVSSSGPGPLGAVLRSSRLNSIRDAYSSVAANVEDAVIISSGYSDTYGDRSQGIASVAQGRFLLAAHTQGAQGYSAEVRTDGDGVLHLNGKNGVLINGQPYMPGSTTPTQTRWQPPLNTGWTQWTNANWNGIWVEQLGKLTIISGAVGKGSWTAGETITTLPSQFWPGAKASGNNCEMQADGRFNIGAAGTGASAMSITYFAR